MKRLKKLKRYVFHVGKGVKNKINTGIKVIQDNSGMSIIEILLILVVIIALVVIFKSQLTALVNTIFKRITKESAGI